MKILAVILGIILILIVLWDAFETIILPRRVTRRIRFARLFHRSTWILYTAFVSSVVSKKNQEAYLSYYGPVSLPALILLWAIGLVFGFALLYWASGSKMYEPEIAPGFLTDLYFSCTTFFTVGLGDVRPRIPGQRAIVMIEAGMGIGYLALIIGYLPLLNQSYSRREVSISLLDSRAGSPPSAAEMLIRHKNADGMEALQQLFHQWELWSAEFLESHLSFPVLAYFRSQHDNQSWLSALTAILDATSLIIIGVEGGCRLQATRTFAMARHAILDLSLIFSTPPKNMEHDRLSADDLAALCAKLSNEGVKLKEDLDFDQRLRELRRTYEPYINSLSEYFFITLPPWMFEFNHADNWQTSGWVPSSNKPGEQEENEHF